MTNINLFSQIVNKLDKTYFRKLVKEKESDKHNKGFDAWTHLVSMLFAQFAKSQSLRDISNGFKVPCQDWQLKPSRSKKSTVQIEHKLSEQAPQLGVIS